MVMITYTVQMEGVRSTGGTSSRGERELNGRVRRQGVDVTGREEVTGSLGAAHDLQQNGSGGRLEGRAVDEEVGTVLWASLI